MGRAPYPWRLGWQLCQRRSSESTLVTAQEQGAAAGWGRAVERRGAGNADRSAALRPRAVARWISDSGRARVRFVTRAVKRRPSEVTHVCYAGQAFAPHERSTSEEKEREADFAREMCQGV
jgi:hypothetical protein